MVRKNEIKSAPNANHGRHRQVRWFSLLIAVGILGVSGTVIADVVLTYAVSSGIGTTATSPFSWQQGANYAAGSGMSLLPASTCNPNPLSSSSSGCFILTQNVNGIQYVPTTLVNALNFQWLATTTRATDVGASELSVAFTGTLPAGSCAYAFISNFAMSPSDFAYNNGAPCSVTASPVGGPTPYATCAAATAQVETVNMATGTTSGTVDCTIAASTAAGTALTISYFVYVPSTTAPTLSTTFYFSPVFT